MYTYEVNKKGKTILAQVFSFRYHKDQEKHENARKKKYRLDELFRFSLSQTTNFAEALGKMFSELSYYI